VPFYPIEHVMKTPELTDEQRASILGDNAAKLLKISLSRRCASVTTLAPSSSGVVPSDDRRLTVLHRRECGPSSIYFAAARQAGLGPRGRSPSGTVRRRRRFSH